MTIYRYALPSDPPWLKSAFKDLGLKEIPGPKDNPKIVGMFAKVGHSWVKDDETAWCAAFVGSHLEGTGYRSTRSLMARSYLKFGKKTLPKRGAIMVIPRGRSDVYGHVAFVLGVENGRVYYLGGNQSNSVSIASSPADKVLGYRWPETAENSVTVKATAGSGAAFAGSGTLDEVQKIATEAQGQFTQLAEWLWWGKIGLAVVGFSLLGYTIYRFLNRHLWAKENPPEDWVDTTGESTLEEQP